MISGLALFPGGIAGAGLLLLRISVASSLLILSALHSGGADWLQFLALLAAVGLYAGFRTRIIAALSLSVPIIGLALGAGLWPFATLYAINALALALTGPGAWSADAVLFGRQTVTLPGQNNTNV